LAAAPGDAAVDAAAAGAAVDCCVVELEDELP